MDVNLWLRVAYSRAFVRVRSIYGEPMWLAVGIGFPLLSSVAMGLLYMSSGVSNFAGFAVLGGIMLAFWGNVLWSMATQFSWDKQMGLFEIYLVSPAPITALLVGMSIGGVAVTAPSAVIIAILGSIFFAPTLNPAWDAVIPIFVLTLAALYSMGMLMASLYLAYGREAESLNEAVQEPVSLLSGMYFPSIGRFSPFPFAIQAIASLIPLTIGMDSLREVLFFAGGLSKVYPSLLILGGMAVILLVVATKALHALEEKGRREGTLAVRML